MAGTAPGNEMNERSPNTFAAPIGLWILALIVIGLGVWWGNRPGPQPGPPTPVLTRFAGKTMGSTYNVVLDAGVLTATQQEEVQATIDRTLDRIIQALSTYQPDSSISAFNRHESVEPFPVAPELAQVVARALEVYDRSGQKFDITVSPLVSLWGFNRKQRRDTLPTHAEVLQLLPQMGSDKLLVTLEPPTLTKKHPKLQLDVNAIAVGFATDEVAAALQRLGYERYLVDVGGELRLGQVKSDGSEWIVQIERPAANAIAPPQPQAFVRLHEAALATSGDYRNYVEIAGQRYSHTLDPTTGWPIAHRLAGVTVIAPDATAADAWATALNVMGPEAGLTAAEANPQLEAFFILRNDDGTYQTQQTSGFARFLLHQEP